MKVTPVKIQVLIWICGIGRARLMSVVGTRSKRWGIVSIKRLADPRQYKYQYSAPRLYPGKWGRELSAEPMSNETQSIHVLSSNNERTITQAF